MASSILTVLFVGLSLSTSSIFLADPLLTISNQNLHNPLISITVHIFLLLVLCTFISATLLLLLYVALPQSTTPAFLTKQLAKATQAMALSVLLVGAPLMLYLAIVDAIVPDAVKASVIGILAVMIFIPFKRYFTLAGLTAGRIVPAFVVLCISMGTLLLVDPILPCFNQNKNNLSSHVLLHLLSFCNFNLGTLLLFLHMCMSQLGPGHGVLIENLVKMTMAMSFATVAAALFMIIALLVGIY